MICATCKLPLALCFCPDVNDRIDRLEESGAILADWEGLRAARKANAPEIARIAAEAAGKLPPPNAPRGQPVIDTTVVIMPNVYGPTADIFEMQFECYELKLEEADPRVGGYAYRMRVAPRGPAFLPPAPWYDFLEVINPRTSDGSPLFFTIIVPFRYFNITVTHRLAP